MNNGLFKISKEQIVSAIVYGLVAMIAGGLLAIANSIIDAGTFIGLDWKVVLDKGAMASLGAFVAVVSVIVSLLTTKRGNFLGAAKIAEDKRY